MSTIDEIKSRIDIVDLVSETVQLRRSGKNYTGFCPFHPNSRTPAFAVFPESGTWRCFGQCNEGGDIFKFVMKREGWDFPEALRYLAEKAGVQLKPPTPEEQAEAEEHAALRQLLEEAATYYRHQLLHTAAGRPALEYLRQTRGLKDETIELFGLGYAPAGYENLLQYFQKRGRSLAELQQAGLLSERESGGYYDRFRNRIMFPIRDERGRMAGFGARILDPNDIPKFLNSPQTPVFDKGRLLYGLDLARRAIRSRERAVIVEGYLDVIALHQAGYSEAVSPMGTALTEHHFRLLKRFTRQVVLALDPDAAGDQATLRGLQVARQALDHSPEAVFDARGLLGYEARLQADIRVTTLPPGVDPDELVARDPQEWERCLTAAQPVVVHVMYALAKGRNLDDPKVKSEIAAQVLPLIEDVPDAVERDTYRQRLARLLRVSERALAETLPTRRSRPSRGRPQPRPAAVPAAIRAAPLNLGNYAQEAYCLGILLRRPALLFRVNRLLQEDELPRLSQEDFKHADHQTIFRLIQQSVDQDLSEPLDFVLNSLSLPMMEMADNMLERTQRLDPNDERVLDDLMRGLLELRRRQLAQDLDYQRILLQEAQEGADEQLTQDLQRVVQINARQKARLDRALKRFTSRSLATRLPG